MEEKYKEYCIVMEYHNTIFNETVEPMSYDEWKAEQEQITVCPNCECQHCLCDEPVEGDYIDENLCYE